jgi:hypothetical protein
MIQVFSKEGDNTSPRGDNIERVNFSLKSSCSEPAGQIQSNLIIIILG